MEEIPTAPILRAWVEQFEDLTLTDLNLQVASMTRLDQRHPVIVVGIQATAAALHLELDVEHDQFRLFVSQAEEETFDSAALEGLADQIAQISELCCFLNARLKRPTPVACGSS